MHCPARWVYRTPSINLLPLVIAAANGVVSGCFQARRGAQMDPIEVPRRE
jgi:hypothetical protein